MQIGIHREEDEQLLHLNEDDKAVALSELNKLTFVAKTAYEQLHNGTLTQGFGTTLISLVEAHLSKLSKLTGISSESAAERDMRFSAIREANLQIRDLEKALGASVNAAHIANAVKALTNKVRHWWRVDGFGYASEVSFVENVCKVTLSCHLSGDFSLLDSPTPISDKERKKIWHAQLRERGFVVQDTRRDDANIIDCDESKKALLLLIRKAFPSSRIIGTKTHCLREGEIFALTEVTLFIYDLTEIEALPEPVFE